MVDRTVMALLLLDPPAYEGQVVRAMFLRQVQLLSDQALGIVNFVCPHGKASVEADLQRLDSIWDLDGGSLSRALGIGKLRNAYADMDENPQVANWYAIQVRSRSEFFTAKLLRNKGFDELVPRYKSKRRWSDRKMDIELPLFPGYIFCRFDPVLRLPIIMTSGVVRIVGIGKAPLPIDAREMEAILHVVNSRYEAEPYPFVTLGERIYIRRGPLAGLEGIISGYKNRRLILSVGLVQRSIAVELDDDTLGAIGLPS